jgi:hypothetical protein
MEIKKSEKTISQKYLFIYSLMVDKKNLKIKSLMVSFLINEYQKTMTEQQNKVISVNHDIQDAYYLDARYFESVEEYERGNVIQNVIVTENQESKGENINCFTIDLFIE